MCRGDIPTGIAWLQKAAEQGLANSQGKLGIFYSTDKLVPRDVVKACVWLTIAAANDCPGDNIMLYKLKKELNPEQIAQVETMIVSLLVKLPRIPFREHADRVGLLPFVNSD